VKGGSEEPLSAYRFIPVPENFWINRGICANCGYEPPPSSWSCPQCGGYVKDSYSRGGYEWCIAHWGTKWGLYDIEVVSDEVGVVDYTFQTAWSPPLPVIVAMGEQFPDLKFTLCYYEGGGGFQGALIVEGGQVVKDKNRPYDGDRGG